MDAPLSGIRVLELASMLPGPFASQVLADFGAEVIKVENPRGGDYMRTNFQKDGQPVTFHAVNRNKKSLALDLGTQEGQDVFKSLTATADVILDGFRPGVLSRLGVGYDDLQPINPRLIYCALTGYGMTGPYRDKAGHDINYLSYAGVLGLTGIAGGSPVISGVQIADIGGGALWAVIAILMALQHRQATGRGQLCDVGMMDGAFAWLPLALAQQDIQGLMPQRGRDPLNGGLACYNVYETLDHKYVSLGALEGKFWGRFCSKIGRQEMISRQMDPASQQAMVGELRELFMTRTREEWTGFFRDEDVCFSPVLDFSEALENEHLLHRGMVAQVGIDRRDTLVTAQPIKLSEGKASIGTTVPGLGRHSRALLNELGYSEQAISLLIASGSLGVEV